jgi:uncharacterized protein (TIGR02391 family)
MMPARYVSTPELFNQRRDDLNVVLAFVGLRVRGDGKVVVVSRASTLLEAQARVNRLRALLEARGTHEEVYKYCRTELLENNYFHALLEAVKGVAERIRNLSGLSGDGAELVNVAFSIKNPVLAFSSLTSETEVSEQKGISNLLVGLFGAIRNPLAHAPKTVWVMSEQDAIDIFSLLSYVHRKLDGVIKI